jgi:two-component system, OmpR family, alkaline phosphatase synthesis response regulator PhoP
MRSILIIEDNESLAFGLRASLQVEGHTVDVVGDGREALERIAVTEPDMIILDLMLPDVSGFEVLRKLRESGSSAAILVLSARDQEVDKVQVFRLGADDYVVKPVGVLELIARVDALFRRLTPVSAHSGSASQRVEYRFGNIVVDAFRRTIHRGDTIVDVRPMEFDLLLHLLEADGRVVSRRVLMQKVWHYAPDVATRTVDQHIQRLRQRLEEDPAAPRHILTVRKSGYRIEP